MKPTIMCADSNYFQHINPDYHEFLASYAHEERIRAAKLSRKPSREYKALKKKKRVTTVDSSDDDGNDSDSSSSSKDISYDNDANGQLDESERGVLKAKKKLSRKSPKKKIPEEEQESEIPEITNDAVTELYYDFQYIDENYTVDDLLKEPRPEMIWAHITCALFTPELFFQDKDNISDIDGFSILSKERFKIDCCICGKKRAGAIVNCEKNHCKKAFHPECARRAKFYLEIKESESLQALVYTMFCESHTPLKLRRTLESKEKKQREDIYKFCKSVERYYSYCITNKKPPKKQNTGIAKLKLEDKERAKKNAQNPKNKLRKKNTETNSSQLYLNLVEEWRRKVPSSLFTITLAKMRHAIKDDENQIVKEETFKVIDTHVPRVNTDKKIAIGDEVWSYMPYKNYNPAQKYKKYKKIIMKMKNRESQEQLSKYIKSTNRALKEEQQNKTTKSSSFLREYHLVVEEPDENIYCICRQQYRADGTDDDMLACDTCGEWYHFGCVGFIQTVRKAKNIAWHCQKCRGIPFPKKVSSSIPAQGQKGKAITMANSDVFCGHGQHSQKGRSPFANKQNLQEPALKKRVKLDTSKTK